MRNGNKKELTEKEDGMFMESLLCFRHLAATAKSLQLCPTLRPHPWDSPPRDMPKKER